MAVESVATVEAIVAQLVESLPQTRYPSADTTWEAGVAFARRWAELSSGEQALALALTPRGQECTLTVTIEPWDEKDDLAALLGRIADIRTGGIAEGLKSTIASARARYADDFDFRRRNIPASASEFERERFKDPYLLDFLGLEPLDGDPTIEQMEHEFAADDE